MAFHLCETDGVTYAVSDMLQARHAFATRLGGVSCLAHTATLNLAFGRGDDESVVMENLTRFSCAVGIDPHAIVSVPQVHGNDVRRVDTHHRGMGYTVPAAWAGDGYVTTDPSVTPGVKTADCTPVLLEAREGEQVIAVAALHAGWKGTVADIAGTGVAMLRAAAADVGVPNPTVYAAIGPCIHACCLAVREDCLAVVRKRLGRFVDPYICNTGNGYTLDLPGLNRALLERAEVAVEHIDISPDCTACRTDLYYSHRAQNGVRGTMLNVISMSNTE